MVGKSCVHLFDKTSARFSNLTCTRAPFLIHSFAHIREAQWVFRLEKGGEVGCGVGVLFFRVLFIKFKTLLTKTVCEPDLYSTFVWVYNSVEIKPASINSILYF